MTFHTLCKSIESRTAGKLALAKSQEQKELILTAALYEYDSTVLKTLNALSKQEGTGTSGYMRAQTAATELLSFLALTFISSCSNYRQGITTLETLAVGCSDKVISRRLTVYANQIKRRWNDADPSALAINPRAAKVRQEKDPLKEVGGAKLLLFLFPVALYLLVHFYLKFPLGNGNQSPPSKAQESTQVTHEVQKDRQAIPAPAISAPQKFSSDGEYFSYTDKQGVVHLGNRPANESVNVSGEATGNGSPAPVSKLTPVVIKGNQVLVPVTLSYGGRSVSATLLLDTGASVTTINERIAGLLGVDQADTTSERTIVADGRTIRSWRFVADSIAVGPRRLPLLHASILPGSGGAEHDGLLGMDFLKNVRYHVDFGRKVIEWGG